ncbi:MAG: hypothetical protein L6Q84_02440 [Polyangiaceae bacterium]|nr:hypothetical protein [Polyangiaceae bacterium]
MSTRAEVVPDWQVGNYVFVDEGIILGRAASVSGLEEALRFASRPLPLEGFPDLHVAGMDRDLERWVADRMKSGGEKWDFAIRDNRKQKWIGVRSAFVHRRSGDTCTLALNGIEPDAET